MVAAEEEKKKMLEKARKSSSYVPTRKEKLSDDNRAHLEKTTHFSVSSAQNDEQNREKVLGSRFAEVYPPRNHAGENAPDRAGDNATDRDVENAFKSRFGGRPRGQIEFPQGQYDG